MKIGIDIQDVSKIATLSVGTLARIFTSREHKYIESKNDAPETVAGIWAAKEAYFKALGIGITHNRMGEVEIRHEDTGAPYLTNEGERISDAHISISHTPTTAVAVCVIAPQHRASTPTESKQDVA